MCFRHVDEVCAILVVQMPDKMLMASLLAAAQQGELTSVATGHAAEQ